MLRLRFGFAAVPACTRPRWGWANGGDPGATKLQYELDPDVLGAPRADGSKDAGPRQGGGDKRGDCKGYTYAVRRRHREAVWPVERSMLPRRSPDGRVLMPCSFVTLTLPKRLWTSDPSQWKAWLEAWWKRVDRRWADAFAVWRLEFRRRGGRTSTC